MTSSRYPAPAKLNLMLRVTGRRADGYHLLQTVFRFVDFSDELCFTVREDGLVTRARDIAGVSMADDLTLGAARLLQTTARVPLGVTIELQKRLPLGAGLGGGSSDAATTLIVLNQLWNLNFSRARLQELALQLGADVPAFIFGESAVGVGIGEQLRRLSLPSAWYLLLLPAVHVSTAFIFQDPGLIRNSNPTKIPPFSPQARRNDLEAVVCQHHPEVALHLAWLRQFGSASMTGSGGCVFSEFSTEDEAKALLQLLPVTMRGVVVQGLQRHPLWHLSA